MRRSALDIFVRTFCAGMDILITFGHPLILTYHATQQIMYLTVVSIPALFIILFVVTFANSIVRKFYDAPFLGPQYSGMIGMSFAFLISGVVSGLFAYRRRQQVEQTIDIIEVIFRSLMRPCGLQYLTW